MSTGPATGLRRARPLLGTLVEIGVPAGAGGGEGAGGGVGAGAGAGGGAAIGVAIDAAVDAAIDAAIDAAFAAIAAAQACLSRFDPRSDVSTFHRLRNGAAMTLNPVTRDVLVAARELQRASAGMFDVSLGSAPEGWAIDGDRLVKLTRDVRLDLGGIGKGHAVDLGVEALIARGCGAGWVNAGGDLRVFGDVDLPVRLRDEQAGGVREFARLRDGAIATSAYGPGCASRLHGGKAGGVGRAHVSVAAPSCLWADALTKVVAGSGDPRHPLLARYGACAWLH